jgi:hypothetical protein
MSLNALEMDVVLRAATALRSHGETELADELNAILLSASHAKAAVAQHRATGKAGRPKASYSIELEPGWQVAAQGMAAATATVKETLTLHGVRGAPSQGSLAVSLSRNGLWQRTFETDNGMATLTVRPAAKSPAASV